MTFLTFTLPPQTVFTGKYDANSEPIFYKPYISVRLNKDHIVSIKTHFHDRLEGEADIQPDLVIKTVDGDTWIVPGTPEHLAQVDRLMGFEGGGDENHA